MTDPRDGGHDGPQSGLTGVLADVADALRIDGWAVRAGREHLEVGAERISVSIQLPGWIHLVGEAARPEAGDLESMLQLSGGGSLLGTLAPYRAAGGDMRTGLFHALVVPDPIPERAEFGRWLGAQLRGLERDLVSLQGEDAGEAGADTDLGGPVLLRAIDRALDGEGYRVAIAGEQVGIAMSPVGLTLSAPNVVMAYAPFEPGERHTPEGLCRFNAEEALGATLIRYRGRGGELGFAAAARLVIPEPRPGPAELGRWLDAAIGHVYFAHHMQTEY